MSEDSRLIEEFLDQLRSEGRSSPAGYRWHRFFGFLKSRKRIGQPDPPVPLILAASAASNGSKHRRLREQLLWAVENDCLDDAIRYLASIPLERWNYGPLDTWHEDYFPSTEDFE